MGKLAFFSYCVSLSSFICGNNYFHPGHVFIVDFWGGAYYLIWGIPFGIFAALLTIIGKYKVVEYTQAFFVAFLGIGAIISLLVINTDVAEIIPHFFTIGDVPSYPEWVIEDYSDVAHTPIALTMLAYVGTMSVA